MKSIVLLNGFLLLFLHHRWTESVEEQKMNLTTLARIIDFFEQNYNYIDTEEGPYSIAINVPRNQCQGNFDPLNEHFSTLKTNAADVRNGIYIEDNHFYKSKDLMAAGPWRCNCKKIENCTSNSVSVLLQNDSTFENFLKRRENDSCVVIYTVYSPCLKLRGYNITRNLENLKNHTGIKAFVFKKVYEVDKNGHRCCDLAKTFTEIVNRVPFYHFVNKTVLPITNEC